MWGIYRNGRLLRRERTVRDALDWATEHYGATVSKVKSIAPAGQYELYITGSVMAEWCGVLRRVDPKGEIADYPSAALPQWKIGTEAKNMAEVIRKRGKAELEYGTKAPVIIALLSVGWNERRIAEALDTSRTYTTRVSLRPKEFVS